MNNSTLTDNGGYMPSSHVFRRHEFLLETPEIAVPSLVILVLASIVGTFGNLLILFSLCTTKNLQTIEAIFIANLAISDMYVTVFADPMSIVAKVEGEQFFEMVPGLCRAIASGCTIACVNSLFTIACMAFNRYIYICHHPYYQKIFKKGTCIVMCACLYCVGSILVLLNLAGIGDHSFDRKSLECIWDRMATFSYTVAYSVTLVWIPIIVIGCSYLSIYIVVRRSDKRMRDATNNQHKGMKSSGLAKTLFIIYAVFALFWTPYALIIVVDINNNFSHVAHVYVTMYAHLHPSINWLVYYFTNRKFQEAFNRIAHLDKCFSRCVMSKQEKITSTTGTSSPSGTMTKMKLSIESNL